MNMNHQEPFDPSLWKCLRHPRRQSKAFDATNPTRDNLPYGTWFWLAIIAVGGTNTYSLSLGVALGVSPSSYFIFPLALSAGIAWCCFSLVVARETERNLLSVEHVCLVTMAFGEAVLLPTAALNFLGHFPGNISPAAFNSIAVIVSNLAMLIAMACQLRELDIPIWKTVAMWFLILDPFGIILFLFFVQLLKGGTP